MRDFSLLKMGLGSFLYFDLTVLCKFSNIQYILQLFPSFPCQLLDFHWLKNWIIVELPNTFLLPYICVLI